MKPKHEWLHQPPYYVEISPVREVSLLGCARADFWAERLRPYGLEPDLDGGAAQIMICGAASKFKGVSFRELSISVAVGFSPGGPGAGFFLVQAFSSVRFFAFVERTLFHTPYLFANVEVQVRPPVEIHVQHKRGSFFRAAMGSLGERTSWPLESEGPASWDGGLFLPERTPKNAREGRMFFARLSGAARTYAFSPAHDQVSIQPLAWAPVGQWLLESNFVGQKWLVRENGQHAKSKTVRTRTMFRGES